MSPTPVILAPANRLPTTGELIKYYREAKKLSQEDLGEAVGLTGQTIGKYEAGRNVKDTTLRKIAAALGVRVDELRPDPDKDPEERWLTEWFREAKPHARRAVLDLARNLREAAMHDAKQESYKQRR